MVGDLFSHQWVLYHCSNFGRHYFFGAGLQMGWRTRLTRNGRFQLELTAGLGFRRAHVEEKMPRRATSTDFHPPGDATVIDMANDIAPAYFPGSMRLIYLFGKRLRP